LVRPSQIAFVSRRVLKSFRELLWSHLLTAGTMAMTLFIFGGFLLLQENLRGLVAGWGSRIQIYAYLDDKMPQAAVEPLVRRIRAYPEVESVRFVSRPEAWESFRKSLGSQSGVLEGLTAEVLPASLEIAVRGDYRDHEALAAAAGRLRAEKGVAQVEYPEEWMEKFSLLTFALASAEWILGGFLLIATLFIVGNTVKLAILARREEIEIMQLVGAPPGLVKLPFVIEGMIQGLLGAALALGFLWLLFFFLESQLPDLPGVFAGRGQLRFLAPQSFLLLLFLGWAMGALGSLFSLGRYLQKW
ncbi:MAG TPA: permease-like cell division protein FtsX, partial [Candidatus Binatia bacterium]